MTKPSLKIETVNKALLFWYWQRLKMFVLRIKLFLFFKTSFSNSYFHFFSRLSDWVEILWGFTKFNFKMNLKVSAFYLEKQKSFIPKKIFLSRCQHQNKKRFSVKVLGSYWQKQITKENRLFLMLALFTHRQILKGWNIVSQEFLSEKNAEYF